jgi:ribosomal protein S21
MTVVRLWKGEHIERALRRLKRPFPVRAHPIPCAAAGSFEMPSIKVRRKMKASIFNAMLRQRRADD